jgi:hypothetical protein
MAEKWGEIVAPLRGGKIFPIGREGVAFRPHAAFLQHCGISVATLKFAPLSGACPNRNE